MRVVISLIVAVAGFVGFVAFLASIALVVVVGVGGVGGSISLLLKGQVYDALFVALITAGIVSMWASVTKFIVNRLNA